MRERFAAPARTILVTGSNHAKPDKPPQLRLVKIGEEIHLTFIGNISGGFFTAQQLHTAISDCENL